MLSDATLLRSKCFIDGTWTDADDGQTLVVTNPATRQPLGTVPKAGQAETRSAIEAAARALPAWRERPAEDRARLLKRWAGLMATHQEDLARIMTLEQGKPLAEARGEVAYAASYIEWFAEEARRL